MPRFIEGQDRRQVTLMPECLDDFIADDNPVRVIDAFVGELDLTKLGFEGAEPAATGRPSYHPADLLKVYIYGYLNRVQSSRRLERECQRNIEMMSLDCADMRDESRSPFNEVRTYFWICDHVAAQEISQEPGCQRRQDSDANSPSLTTAKRRRIGRRMLNLAHSFARPDQKVLARPG